MRIKKRLMFALLITLAPLISCAKVERPVKKPPGPNLVQLEKAKVSRHDTQIPREIITLKAQKPDFIPVSEELSPLETKVLSLNVRNTPLKDVLYIIAESTGLNLIMEKEVDVEIPITVTLKDVVASEVLEHVLSSVDYFFAVKRNMLTVKAYESRIFEFGRPSVIQDYSVNVGGDILGGASTDNSRIQGSVSQSLAGDNKSMKFWESLESALASMLGIIIDEEGAAEEVSVSGSSFSINRMTGAIYVRATKKDLQRVEAYLKRIKKILSRQVMIEARIVEVELSKGLKYGIDWTSFIRGSGGKTDASFGANKFSSVTGSMPNFSFNISGGDFTGLLKALKSQGEIDVLSNPRISIMNGQTAMLSVGRKVDFVSKVETTASEATGGSLPTLTFSVETSSVLSGILFGIVPYIEDDHNISLTITPIISDLVGMEEKSIGNAASSSVEISLPTVDLRELSTTVNVANEQIVIIGGLIQKNKKITENKVPVLSSLPFIGNLFKSHDSRDVKSELVIILKPVITKG